LTRTVVEYATAGPVAKNHCEERLKAVQSTWNKFEELFTEISQPGSRASALNELRQVQEFLQSVWKEHNGLRGLNLKLGAAAARRLDDVAYIGLLDRLYKLYLVKE